MAKIAALAVERDLLVLFDEIYKAFLFDGAEHVNIAAFPGMRARTVIVGSLQQGIRDDGLARRLCRGRGASASSRSPISNLRSRSVRRRRRSGRRSRRSPARKTPSPRCSTISTSAAPPLLPKLTAMGLPHGNPRGAYYVFADIRSTGLSSAECARVFLERAGVRTLPGHLFGPGGEGYLRFSLASARPAHPRSNDPPRPPRPRVAGR